MAETGSAIIKMKGLDQVGIIVEDIEKTVKDYWNILGIGPHIILTIEPVDGYVLTYRGKPARYTFRASFAKVGPVELELIQSIDGPTIYDDYLAEQGEGANHMRYSVESVEEIHKHVEIMSKKGLNMLMGGHLGDSVGYAYMDTVNPLKTILEVVKMPEGPDDVPTLIYPSSDSEGGSPKLNVKAISRIGFVVKDLEEVIGNYRKILGIEHWEIWESGKSLFRNITYRGKTVDPEWKVAKADAGPVKLEFVQPLSGENIYSDFLSEHGEGIHYLQFMVDDIRETNRIMEEGGGPVLMRGEGRDGEFAFYDTSGPLKVVWEAVQEQKI